MSVECYLDHEHDHEDGAQQVEVVLPREVVGQHLHSTVQYSTVQYSTVQHSTVQYSTAQYSTVRAQNVGPNHRSEIVQNRQIRPRPRPRPGCQDPPCRRPRAPAADVAPAGPAVAAAPAHDRAGRGGGGGGAAAAAGGHPAPPHQRALQAKSFKPLPQIQDLIL